MVVLLFSLSTNHDDRPIGPRYLCLNTVRAKNVEGPSCPGRGPSFPYSGVRRFCAVQIMHNSYFSYKIC